MDLHSGLDIEVYDLRPTDLHYYYYYYYKSTDYSDASLKLQGHFTYHIKKTMVDSKIRSQLYDS